MGRDSLIGAVGTLASFTLDSVHLIAATLCAILTGIHVGFSLYLKWRDKNKK